MMCHTHVHTNINYPIAAATPDQLKYYPEETKQQKRIWRIRPESPYIEGVREVRVCAVIVGSYSDTCIELMLF